MAELTSWAETMKQVFIGGSTSQFVLYGNVFDLVPIARKNSSTDFVSLRDYLEEAMFAPFEVVIFYDRGKGIRIKRGMDEFRKYLSIHDSFNDTNYATYPGHLPRDSRRALELVDRFIQVGLQRTRYIDNTSGITGGPLKSVHDPLKIAVVVDYSQYVAPRAEITQLMGDSAETLIKILDWASDPSILGANIVTCLITENLQDLNKLIVENPYNSKIKVPMPTEKELIDYCEHLRHKTPDFSKYCKMTPELFGQSMLGLTRVGVRSVVALAVNNQMELNQKFLSQNKKKIIEKECNDLLEFIEVPYNLDMVAGHKAAKEWLREDTQLIKEGKTRSIPMGYLLTGGIGTGKTFLANCWAGELGIPFVKFKNFRDKWQGSTEGNLEKIFTVMDALGQVIVFIDEADQSTGKRDGGGGDSGVSGRVYSMLAQKMSDTRNRGKIIWILATSRPDLLEVDLKRQGRLDVHIPLFPPQTDKERNELFKVVVKKSGSDLPVTKLPKLPKNIALGGNEMEALIVRAFRVYDLQKSKKKRTLEDIIAELLTDFRPSAHTKALEYMDLVAVKECTDTKFLPEHFKNMSMEELDTRIEELKYNL